MPKVTLREQNKSDKLRRISEAARELFGSQGYDATATRQIADTARVGLATLFLYAADKRDLLFLACNDDLEALTIRAFSGIDTELSLLDQLTAAFRHFFTFYARNRMLSRDLLRELTFYTSGQQSERFQATRQATIKNVARLIRDARKAGRIDANVVEADAAQVIFYVFAAEVRRWLGEEHSASASGIDRLRVLLGVVVDGLTATSPVKRARSNTTRIEATASTAP